MTQNRNQNRPGYKKTKVGWIPEEWEVVRLQDVCTEGGQYGCGAQTRQYDLKKTRYIRITDITESGELRNNGKASVDSDDVKGRLLRKGDFLFARTGATVGKTYLHKADSGSYAYAGYLIRFVPDDKKLLGYYLKDYTQTSRYWYWIQNTLHAGAQPNINAEEYANLPIPLPPLPEQKKIAEILSTWDNAIEQTRNLLDAKKRRKKGLMQQLLTGKMRLPQFRAKRGDSKKHEICENELPRGWKEKKLGDLFTERKETGYNDLPLLAVTGSRGVIPANEVERKDLSSQDKSRYKRICPGDIGYNTMRMWQGVSAFSQLEGIVSPAYTICTPRQNMNASFAAYLFKLNQIIHLFWRYSQGMVSDTLNLKYNNFSEIRVVVPEKAEQQAIAEVLETADKEIKLLESKLAALEKQKRGLMQKLLTGEVRVKV